MKVVLFCGGFSMRMRGHEHDPVPKPMQMVGPQPLLWHVMRYYAHFGHRDFILCLGYGAGAVKDFFLNYHEAESNDFILQEGNVELLASDISDWRITFADTGLTSGLGDRLLAVRKYLGDDEMFLANYADVLCDLNLEEHIAAFERRPEMVASLLAVPPQASFHVVDVADSGDGSGRPDQPVTGMRSLEDTPMLANGGYMIMRREIFDYLEPGDDIVMDAFRRAIDDNRMLAYRHQGFWRPADTFKERAELDQMWNNGVRPWAIWERP